MSGGDIAALIAAGGFVLLVLFSAVPLLKLGRVLDETRNSIRDLNESVSPLLTELTETVAQTNKQLERVDVITENVAEMSANINSVVAVFTSAIGSPLAKFAGIAQSIISSVSGKKKK